MPTDEYNALLRRRRIWGVPPDVAEQMLAACERTQAELRAQITDLESRLADVLAQCDEAHRTVDTQKEAIARLERENEAIANRPEMVREEAVRFVVDAYAEAQALREQTQREIAAAQETARQEAAAMRAEMAEERRRHEAAMREERERHEAEMAAMRQRYETETAMLRERRERAVTDLQSLAAGLLNQARRGDATTAPPSTEMEHAGAPSDAPDTAEPPSPDAPAPAAHDAPAHANGATEDEMLARALDELEAILSVPRKQNGA